MRPLIFSLLLALLAAGARAQDGKSAAGLLQQVGERYGALQKFHFEAVEVTSTRSGDFERTTKNRVVTALDGQGRSRVEFSDGTTGGVTVSNGETTWVYFPHLKKYSKFAGMPVEGASDKLGKLRGLDFSRIARRFTDRYKGAGQSVMEAKIVRSETIEIAGKAYNCQVVEARYETPQGLSEGQVVRTFWIDSASKMILRELSNASMKPANLDKPVQVRQQIEFRVANAGADLSPDLFVFHPPEGVEEVGASEIEGGNGAALTGQPAPEFALQDLAGNNVTLEVARRGHRPRFLGDLVHALPRGPAAHRGPAHRAETSRPARVRRQR